jgi:hypothetical protein
MSNNDDNAVLHVLLAQPELDLNAECAGATAEWWAFHMQPPEVEVAITRERHRRSRWTILRAWWVAVIMRCSQ